MVAINLPPAASGPDGECRWLTRLVEHVVLNCRAGGEKLSTNRQVRFCFPSAHLGSCSRKSVFPDHCRASGSAARIMNVVTGRSQQDKTLRSPLSSHNRTEGEVKDAPCPGFTQVTGHRNVQRGGVMGKRHGRPSAQYRYEHYDPRM